MPWLAPIGTPLASGPIDSHEPSWQSSRACEVRRIGLDPRQPARQQRQPVQRLRIGDRDWPRREQMPSTQ